MLAFCLLMAATIEATAVPAVNPKNKQILHRDSSKEYPVPDGQSFWSCLSVGICGLISACRLERMAWQNQAYR